MDGTTAMGLVLCHLVGDYVLQSHWMATQKTERISVATLHAAIYTLPFAFLTQSLLALFVIFSTHAAIDRWRLAKYVGYAKNQFGPAWSRPAYTEAMVNGGYSAETPLWLSSFLLFVTDNTMHMVINALSVQYL